jgi:hypothetical protein
MRALRQLLKNIVAHVREPAQAFRTARICIRQRLIWRITASSRVSPNGALD